ncbi:MAG: hypothetical protein AAF986_05235 [Pseudomonadota bacterium]
MIKWLLRKSAHSFGKAYNYDVSYMIAIINTSAGAGLRLALAPLLSQYCAPKKAVGVWAGATLAATLDADCGPCAQLAADMAIELGVEPSVLHLCIGGRADEADDVGLGFRYARAILSGAPDVDELRADINALYGEKAVISAAFAAASARFYPVLKKGLGHGVSCQQLKLGNITATVERHHE